jgi:phosphoserine phosphatase
MPSPPQHILDLLINTDAIAFDVDSTIVKDEGIDLLAEHHNVYDLVSAYTKAAMSGKIDFYTALNDRLNIIKPTTETLDACIKAYPHRFTDGFLELIKTLRAHNKQIFLISGGFLQMIMPIAAELNIPDSNIIANNLAFDAKGHYVGFDETMYTCRTSGKALAIKHLIDVFNLKSIIMIGDGVTDLEAKTTATAMIGYGGCVTRDKVQDEADWFINSWYELIDLFKAV